MSSLPSSSMNQAVNRSPSHEASVVHAHDHQLSEPAGKQAYALAAAFDENIMPPLPPSYQHQERRVVPSLSLTDRLIQFAESAGQIADFERKKKYVVPDQELEDFLGNIETRLVNGDLHEDVLRASQRSEYFICLTVPTFQHQRYLLRIGHTRGRSFKFDLYCRRSTPNCHQRHDAARNPFLWCECLYVKLRWDAHSSRTNSAKGYMRDKTNINKRKKWRSSPY